MATDPSSPTGGGTPTATSSAATSTASTTSASPYTLLASESTVQILGPTLANPVEYCTIQTHPSESIVAIPVQKDVFDHGQAGVELTNFANAVEQIVAYSYVSAATGQQSVDAHGLLADQVAFTVMYVHPDRSGTQITAEALVPVGMLNFTDALIGRTLLAEVNAIIDTVYNNLKAAVGG